MANTKLKTADINKSADSGETITKEELANLRKEAARVETLEKQASKVADLEKAVKESEKLKAEIAELQKSAAKLAELEKAAEAKAHEDMEDLVKSFTYVSEEDKESLVASLLKSKDKTILAQLNKAQEVINTFATEEHGSDASADLEKTAAEKADEDFNNFAAELIKSRNKGAK